MDGEDEQIAPQDPPEGQEPSVRNLVYIPYLRAWRTSKGLTREQLAARMQAAGVKPISLFTFRSIEAYGKPAKVETAVRIAKGLGIQVDDLLHKDPFKMPPGQP